MYPYNQSLPPRNHLDKLFFILIYFVNLYAVILSIVRVVPKIVLQATEYDFLSHSLVLHYKYIFSQKWLPKFYSFQLQY